MDETIGYQAEIKSLSYCFSWRKAKSVFVFSLDTETVFIDETNIREMRK